MRSALAVVIVASAATVAHADRSVGGKVIDEVTGAPVIGALVAVDLVENVTNRKNAEGVKYEMDFTVRKFTRGLPIFPSIGIEYIP